MFADGGGGAVSQIAKETTLLPQSCGHVFLLLTALDLFLSVIVFCFIFSQSSIKFCGAFFMKICSQKKFAALSVIYNG